jgi:hypothetical protein
LELEGFTSMQFSGRTVWLHENGSTELLKGLEGLVEVDDTGPAPARYCNTQSMRAYLVLRSFTTRICELFQHLASGSSYAIAKQKENSKVVDPWLNARDHPEPEDVVMGEDAQPKFTKPLSYDMKNAPDARFEKLLGLCLGSGAGVSSSSVAFRHFDTPTGFMTPSESTLLTHHGLVLKFHPQLALPDPNLIADVIGRHFLAGLGDTIEEQTENLALLKTGLSALRLTRVGDELTHLYKCIDIAIQCRAGCIPVMSGSRYEGTVVMGGPGAVLIHNGADFPFESVTSLKQTFLSISAHVVHLAAIANLLTSDADTRALIKDVTSMVGLREFCLVSSIDQQGKDEVIRRASNLEFSPDTWVINPANLKALFKLIASPSTLNGEVHPIGRMSLFETDMVTVAMSMFGEKSAPSWDIPSGVLCSLKAANPPSPPSAKVQGKQKNRGDISDAAWVMVIRRTDLFSAVADFRVMADTLSYRSSSSALAKKVGHRVFGRDRMAEFWGDLREALRVINPNAAYDEVGISQKRIASDTPSTLRASEEPKRRRMAY